MEARILLMYIYFANGLVPLDTKYQKYWSIFDKLNSFKNINWGPLYPTPTSKP